MLQATARAEGRAIAGKALTGTGYEGHAFWDTETFVLQVMTAVRPEVTRHALGWRHATLPPARDRARTLDLKGATFPWRTITGPECSGYWPAGTAAFHVNAAVADAVLRYVDATEDEEFAREVGVELLVETARLWCSLGHWGRDERFHVFGVTGPDEYSALGDDNVYTNLMMQRNLRGAAGWAAAYREAAERLEVTADEIASWERAADAVFVPYDEELGVHPQSAGFTLQPRWDLAATPEENYPLHSHYPYLQLYRKQVVKQADLVLALFLRGDAFTDEEKVRDFIYYEEITVRDSSLSACCQAIIAAEVGLPHLAHEYVVESALADIRDAEHDSSDGLHIAALAGTWLALVCGFGGLRQVDTRALVPPGAARRAAPAALPVALPRPAAAGDGRAGLRDVRAPARGAVDGAARARRRRDRGGCPGDPADGGAATAPAASTAGVPGPGPGHDVAERQQPGGAGLVQDGGAELTSGRRPAIGTRCGIVDVQEGPPGPAHPRRRRWARERSPERTDAPGPSAATSSGGPLRPGTSSSTTSTAAAARSC
jgi:trehalose/maltose hydrolase-like predicted phosphorylase